MDLSDRIFMANRDWDHAYLKSIFTQDFYEFRELWHSNVGDTELLRAECCSPIVENISLDDDTLYEAVAEIENE